MVKTTDFIKNINVLFDEIAIDNVSEDDFVITNITEEKKIEEREEQVVQQDLLFDLPLATSKEETSDLVETTDFIKNIPVSAEEVKPVIERRYVLEDFDSKPTIGKSSVPSVKKEELEEELQFEVISKKETEVSDIEENKEVSPLSLTISELERRAKERREKMKGFNYKFNDQLSKNIDEIEREPAYKRLGLDIDTEKTALSKEKTALKKNNDDLNLNGNNSFLHDNVD